MATENGDARHALIQALGQQPHRFQLFAALRLLERAHPEKAGFGLGFRPGDEPARLGQVPSLAPAPAHSVVAFDPERARLYCSFFGLLGAGGVLPSHFTHVALAGETLSRDDSFSRFLDIFHHRLLALYYRVWADVEPIVDLERQNAAGFFSWLGALLGIAARSDEGPHTTPGSAMLAAAARQAQRSTTADGLIAVVYAGVRYPAEIQEFVAEWLPLEQNSRWRLGDRRQAALLGATTLLGSRVWSAQHKIRIRIRVSTSDDLSRLASNAPDMRRLEALVTEYVGTELDWDVEIAIAEDQIPPFRLGVATLGRTTWLHRADTRSGDVTIHCARTRGAAIRAALRT